MANLPNPPVVTSSSFGNIIVKVAESNKAAVVQVGDKTLKLTVAELTALINGLNKHSEKR